MGGMVSLTIKISTLISLLFYLDKMFNFKDPAVISYELDLTIEEQENIGSVNFANRNFFMSLYPKIDGVYVEEIPPEVGSIRAWLYVG